MPKRSSIAHVAVLVMVLLALAGGSVFACVGSPFGGGLSCSTAADTHEPNDELQQATPLVPGETGAAPREMGGRGGDVDIFASEAAQAGGGPSFRIEIESDRAKDLEVQVGASIPGAWEGISWPGWKPKRSGDLIVVEGVLKEGTVLIFVTAGRRADYTVRIGWR
jgi:hypothetical protein